MEIACVVSTAVGTWCRKILNFYEKVSNKLAVCNGKVSFTSKRIRFLGSFIQKVVISMYC